MTSKASFLLILLFLSIAYPALAVPEDLPGLFPTNPPKNTHIHAVFEKIKGACLLFGNLIEKLKVTVLGTKSPAIGGCVKRSEVQGSGSSFPDWSQGTDSQIHYDSAFHEKDDEDNNQNSDDGKDGDAKTTGGEQDIQRSLRRKRCFGNSVTTTTQRYHNEIFEDRKKQWDPMSRRFTMEKRRARRSVDGNLNEKYKSTVDNGVDGLRKVNIFRLV